MIRTATVQQIEEHLISLGGGNHDDNMARVREYPRHYLISLTEQQFRDLVFLQNPTTAKITPHNSDRRLVAVAQRALELPRPESKLGPNWDIAANFDRFRQAISRESVPELPALLLRDLRGSSESRWSPGGWYLQDGSHRALSYCMAILAGELDFITQSAYCATSMQLAVSL
jgi:hypothetical protein